MGPFGWELSSRLTIRSQSLSPGAEDVAFDPRCTRAVGDIGADRFRDLLVDRSSSRLV